MAHKTYPMSKRQFRIGELATLLEVENYVIRFWEKEFKLAATRSDGGQRFYTVKDLQRFAKIKELLYSKGFTIAGARQELKRKKEPATFTAARNATSPATTTLKKKLLALAKQLQEFQERL